MPGINIAFNLVSCGLANNGGSQSIARMAMALDELSHSVKILLDSPDRFTWFEIPARLKHFVTGIDRDVSRWPKYDIIVATGCNTVESTVSYPHLSMKNKFYWIRGHETWANPEEQLFKKYKSGLNLLVNSEWLKRMLNDVCLVDSKIQYPGLPIDEIFSCLKHGMTESPTGKVTIGALYYMDKHTKKFMDILQMAYHLQTIGLLHELILFGDKTLMPQVVDGLSYIPFKFFLRPTFEKKIEIMSLCDIWLSTTILEGLHIPPMEAGLCNCNLVVRDCTKSGVSDYAINNFTSLNYISIPDAIHSIFMYAENLDLANNHKSNLKQLLHEKIGSVKDNAIKMQTIFESVL